MTHLHEIRFDTASPKAHKDDICLKIDGLHLGEGDWRPGQNRLNLDCEIQTICYYKVGGMRGVDGGETMPATGGRRDSAPRRGNGHGKCQGRISAERFGKREPIPQERCPRGQDDSNCRQAGNSRRLAAITRVEAKIWIG